MVITLTNFYKKVHPDKKEEGPLKESDFDICREYAKEASKYPVDEVETPPSIEQFEATIIEYLESNATKVDGVKIHCNTIITLDHSILIKGSNKQENAQDFNDYKKYTKKLELTIENLNEKLVKLKNELE